MKHFSLLLHILLLVFFLIFFLIVFFIRLVILLFCKRIFLFFFIFFGVFFVFFLIIFFGSNFTKSRCIKDRPMLFRLNSLAHCRGYFCCKTFHNNILFIKIKEGKASHALLIIDSYRRRFEK